MLDGSIAFPHSIWHHVRLRHLEIVSQIGNRVPVYLDSRFWIDLRYAREGDRRGSHARDLLAKLTSLVQRGIIFCPISANTLIEMFKHADRDIRIRNARLVDELSLGISLVNSEQLAEAELEWLLTKPGNTAIDPAIVPIWTKLTYSLGVLVPETSQIAPEILLALQVATFDEMWSSSLTDFAMRVQQFPDLTSADSARKMTEDNRKFAHEVINFENVYRSEITGSADLYAQIFSDVMRRKAGQEGVTSTGPTIDDLKLYQNIIENIQIFGKSRLLLRSFHIRASLYAIIRLNKDRRFKPNDLLDIEHAIAGIGYCRAFFTESALLTAIKQKPLKLDTLYACSATSDFKEAETIISAIGDT